MVIFKYFPEFICTRFSDVYDQIQTNPKHIEFGSSDICELFLAIGNYILVFVLLWQLVVSTILLLGIQYYEDEIKKHLPKPGMILGTPLLVPAHHIQLMSAPLHK